MSVDVTPNQEEYKNLTPFKLCMYKNFPYIAQDFDAVTNYELLCKVVAYLNEVIENENIVTNNVKELYNSFLELQKYVNDFFDNLDVQDEVNKKLDEMIQDGTLSKLLDPFFDTINNEISNLNNIKRDKGDLILMRDLGQDVKEALTGGSTAVVGIKSVGEANIINYSITPRMLTFNVAQTANLFDKSTMQDFYYDINNGNHLTGNFISPDFILLGDYTKNETRIFAPTGVSAIVYFNANKEFLGYTTQNQLIPFDNVVYISANIPKLTDLTLVSMTKTPATNYSKNTLTTPNYLTGNFIEVPTDNIIGNTISPENVTFIKHVTNNLYSKFTADYRGYFDNNGYYRYVPDHAYGNSGFMEVGAYVVNETKFYQSPVPGFIESYDANYNFLGAINDNQDTDFVIPYENCAYIVKDIRKTDMDNYYLKKESGDLIDYYELDESIQVNNLPNSILSLKKVGFLGDSITYGLGATTPFPTVIHNNTNCISLNYGISQSTIGATDKTTAVPMSERYNLMDSNLDYICVFGGSNDYDYQIPIGTSTDTTNTTFYGALNVLISGLIERYPGKPLIFLTPLYRTLNRESGYKFLDYVNAIIERCNYYSIPVFNLTERSTIKSLINTINTKYYVNGDRLHPNNEGHLILARVIQHQLEII